jgi:hypothetical protein
MNTSAVLTTPSTTASCPTAPAHVVVSSFQLAFDKTAEARAKLEAQDILPLNLDIPSAVATVIGALARAKGLHSEVIKLFAAPTLVEIEALETYADALSFAHTAVQAASRPTPPLQPLFEQASALRDLLLSDATALACRGFIDPKVLQKLKGGTGYLAIAYDLGTIVHVMRERWAEISMRSAVQPFELDQAEKLYEQVTRAFADRERQSEAVAIATAERARAYTLMVKAYDHLRRAATFIRWEEGDANKFVPSLYAGRGGRGKHDDEEEKKELQSKLPPAITTAPAPEMPEVPAVAPGMPGGSPFSS